ncbi:uncharacterized protein LOC111302694 [Durio zibethinus]|uniref:Uncharacterized protein LOC111302694 n=1 Tax=Durio zibethinus TaxID=66656 RepID=A0A6P5ZPA4_DURZI|nr:uncharacterized protein LOC111302694 [Durio zibethinus]
MHGVFPHQQTLRYTPNGPSTTPSRLETLSVSFRSIYLFLAMYFSFSSDSHSLLITFLFAVFSYPPTQDSVIQVMEQSYNSCNLKDPILYMKNGNSLFNITKAGEFFFTSGEPGHCEKKQKLYISVLSGNGSAYAPSYGPSALPETASSPSYSSLWHNPSTAFFFHLARIPTLHYSCYCIIHVGNNQWHDVKSVANLVSNIQTHDVFTDKTESMSLKEGIGHLLLLFSKKKERRTNTLMRPSNEDA